MPQYPLVFAKYNNTIIGPDAAIVLPTLTEKVDYESEFAFVIGRTAQRASGGCAGLCCGLSALQRC